MSKLAFPTDWGESSELPFADGPRVVPEYLATMMAGFDTSRYTYERAVQLANGGLVDEHFGKVRQKMTRDHFDEARRGRD